MKKATASFKIDNAGQIYTAAANKKWNAVFRVGAQLNTIVNPEVLRRAVCDLEARFPSLYVRLHKGMYNDYLVSADGCDVVCREITYPCRPFDLKDASKPLFRVLYGENHVAVEFFHSLTDGSGAMIFLKSLLARYLEICGIEVEKEFGVKDYAQAPSEKETEDSFYKVYDKKRHDSRNEPNAYQYLPEKRDNFLQVTNGYIDVASLKKITKEKYNCTITEYLVSVYCYAFMQQYLADPKNQKSKRPVRISVPANLRSFFPSETLRNFAMFTNVDIYPNKKQYAFTDILAEIKAKMKRGLDKDALLNTACQNVHDSEMPISKYAPAAIRKMVEKQCFRIFGERKYSSPLTNLGLQKIPSAMRPFVKNFEFMVGETVLNRIACGVIALGNEMNITFSSVSEDTAIQDCFFSLMKKHGAVLRVESNMGKGLDVGFTTVKAGKRRKAA